MRLLVSLGGSTVNELRFDRGPVYIGRQMGSQVFLPDKAVSRQHAVLYTTRDGTWIIEDLGSSNKTLLNQVAIHKNELKNNDIVKVADFSIKVVLDEEDVDANKLSAMEDTVTGVEGGGQLRKELHTVERNTDTVDAPPIKFPGKRIKQLTLAIDKISKCNTLKELNTVLVDLLLGQLQGHTVWIGLRKSKTGPMLIQGGKKLTTETVERLHLALPNSLEEVQGKNIPLLVHQLPKQITSRGVRSVIISPIVHDTGCFGVLYIENSIEHTHYSLADLDYLLILGVFTGCCMQRMDH